MSPGVHTKGMAKTHPIYRAFRSVNVDNTERCIDSVNSTPENFFHVRGKPRGKQLSQDSARTRTPKRRPAN